MKKININKISLNKDVVGDDERKVLTNNILINGNILPKAVSYRDIDRSVIDFVKNQLEVFYDNGKLPVYFFTQQRFSEFSKTWEHLDDNNNLQTDFVIITRENNPKKGLLHNEYWNMPGNRFYEIGTSEKWDGNKNILVSYKMKQPYCVDFIYEIKLITTTTDLLNIFNNKVQDTFKSRQVYVKPNNHNMPITLEDISDDSDYDLEEKKMFIQTFVFNVMGYIINESDLKVEENICRTILGFQVESNRNNYSLFQDDKIIVDIPVGLNRISTKSNGYYNINSINSSNISSFKVKINNKPYDVPMVINKYDKIDVYVVKEDISLVSKIKFEI